MGFFLNDFNLKEIAMALRVSHKLKLNALFSLTHASFVLPLLSHPPPFSLTLPCPLLHHHAGHHLTITATISSSHNTGKGESTLANHQRWLHHHQIEERKMMHQLTTTSTDAETLSRGRRWRIVGVFVMFLLPSLVGELWFFIIVVIVDSLWSLWRWWWFIVVERIGRR